MKTLVPLFVGIAIVLFSSESFAQNRKSIGFGYEYTAAASPLTRSHAANVELQFPIGDSRFSRIYSMSLGRDEAGIYGRAPGGLMATVIIWGVLGFIDSQNRTGLSDLNNFVLVPDGLSFDLMRRDRLRAGLYGDFLTFDYRGGDLNYAPDLGLRADFPLTERSFLFVKGAARFFNVFGGNDVKAAPQITVGIARSF